MNNFTQRTLTGIVIVALVTTAILFSVYTFLLLCFIAATIGLTEFYRLFKMDRIRQASGIALSVFLFFTATCVVTHIIEPRFLLLNLLLVSSLFISELFLKSGNPFYNLAFTLLGIVYVTVPFVLLFACAFYPSDHSFQPYVIIGYFLLLWANDTGAYVVGSLIGKRPLFKRISPAKTWEGSAGGVFFTAAAVTVNHFLIQDISLAGWVVTAGLVVVMGTLGDLVKSAMKRSLGVKDCGRLMPGHGGILDRFDSMMGSVPFVYVWWVWGGG